MDAAIAIINWNSGRLLGACVQSAVATAPGAEILVIDNASDDDSLASMTESNSGARIVRNRANRGFAGAVNQAFSLTSSPFVLILNPDLRAAPGAVELLENVLRAHPRAAAAGGHVGANYLPRRIPTAGSLVLENLHLYRTRRMDLTTTPTRVEQPAAAALMIRRSAYEDAGKFDEQFYPAWYEDVDFCRRLLLKQWELYFAPEAIFWHEGGYSANRIGAPEFLRVYYSNQLRYARKHFGPLGAAAVRASIAAGMLARMVGRPAQAAAYGKALAGVVKK